MTDAELIAEAVTLSGLSSRRFAERILGRDERTIRSWRAGQVMPPLLRLWLVGWCALSIRARATVVRMLAS